MISIIIPVYNGSKFIVEAYKNILSQNISSVEMIFIDNNSTDDSVKIIEELVDKDDRIKIFFEKKQGAGAARNKGIINAKGNFIYFFDVDDLLFKDSIKSLKRVLKENLNIESVFGNWVQVRDRNINNLKEICEETLKTEFHQAPYYGMRWFKDISLLYGTPSFLHRKSVFEKTGLFPEEITIGEDATFHIRLGMNCTIAHLDKYIFAYYRHQDSTMSKANNLLPKYFLHWPQYVKIHIPYFFNNETPKEYKTILENRVFVSIAKMIFFKKNKKERQTLFNNNKKEIHPLKIPILINGFFKLLIITKSKLVFKMLIYYIIPYYVKIIKK